MKSFIFAILLCCSTTVVSESLPKEDDRCWLFETVNGDKHRITLKKDVKFFTLAGTPDMTINNIKMTLPFTRSHAPAWECIPVHNEGEKPL